MSEPGEMAKAPDMFYLVSDPETGSCDATLEIWQLGEHSQEMIETLGRITALNGGAFAQSQKRDARGVTPVSILIGLELPRRLPKVPKEAQFITVGEERSCALRVSYREPYATPPASHPAINAAVGALVGNPYITIKRRVIR